METLEEFGAVIKTVFDKTSVQKTTSEVKTFKSKISQALNDVRVGFNMNQPQRSAKELNEELERANSLMTTLQSKRLNLLEQGARQNLADTTEYLNKLNKTSFAGMNSRQMADLVMERERITAQVNRLQNIINSGDFNKVTELNLQINGLSDVERSIENLNEEMRYLNLMSGNIDSSGFFRLGVEISNIKNKYDDFRRKVKSDKNLFNELIKGAVRYSFALLGVRTIWTGIRKSMMTYLQQNDDLYQKLQACYYAIGSLFAPVLEYIVNLIIKLVSWVNALVQALGFAGINMKNFNKQAGKAAKSLAPFDEINNIGGNEGGASFKTPSFQLSDKELGFIDKISKWLPSILAFIGAIATGIELAKLALKGIIDPITAIKGFGIALALAGIVLAINALINYLNDPTWFNFGMIFTGIGTAILGLGIVLGNVPLMIAGAIVAITGIVAAFWPQINNFFKKVEQTISNWTKWIHDHLTTNGTLWGAIIGSAIETVLTTINKFIEIIRTWLDNTFNSVRTVLDGIITFCKGNFLEGIKMIFKGLIDFMKTQFTTFKNLVSTFLGEIFEFFKKLFVNIGSLFSEKVRSIINNYIVDPINRVINWINDRLHFSYNGLRILGKEIIPAFNVRLANLGTIPRLATGTNYVPNDMLAMLHKGEAVVPREFNQNQFFNDSEVADLIRELINVVEQKNFNVNIDGNKIAQNTVRYINDQTRILGRSLV